MSSTQEDPRAVRLNGLIQQAIRRGGLRLDRGAQEFVAGLVNQMAFSARSSGAGEPEIDAALEEIESRLNRESAAFGAGTVLTVEDARSAAERMCSVPPFCY
jgi:hypothetical protein